MKTAHHAHHAETCRIAHPGIVESIGDTYVSVKITQHSACDTCRAKLICVGDHETRNSIVKAVLQNPADRPALHPGSPVVVELEEAMAWLTIILAFAVPLALMLTTFFVTLTSTGREAAAGIAAMLILAPYYLVLGLNRNRLNRRVFFTARPGVLESTH